MNIPRFETHQDQLFMMLETPEPLMPDSKTPCLIWLIKDGRLGELNKCLEDQEVER